MNKKALTLLEIIVSCLILALLMTGLANIFVAGKRWVIHSRSRMTSGELGKLFLDPLHMAVRQDTWNQTGNSLNVGITYCDSDPNHAQNSSCPPSQADRTLDNIEYSAQYNISNIQPDPIGNPQSILRKVVTTIGWNEPAP